MKRLLITLCTLLIIVGSAAAQRVKRDASGRLLRTETIVSKPRTDTIANRNGKATGYFYKTSDGQYLPVMQGSKGGLYVDRVSKKTGEPYRMYLDEKQKAKLIKR